MIIKSLLDTDLYKLTMMQAVYHQFPTVDVKYAFKCRNKGIDFSNCFSDIDDEINIFSKLAFKEEELNYLSSLPYFKKDFIDFLRSFRFNSNDIKLKISISGEELIINIEGKWLNTILYEVPVLAIVNECYFKRFDKRKDNEIMGEFNQRIDEKIKLIKEVGEGFKFVDFGTRRRFDLNIQSMMIENFVKECPKNLLGTSNIMLAKEYGIKPIGTMAHEFQQAAQALTRIQDSIKFSLQRWQDEYRGQLGIALSDVLGIDVFLREFDLYFAKLYDGVRQDSGNPFEVARKIIQHYKNLGINPKTKILTFSDGLDVLKAIELYKNFKDEINCSFGIGTNLTNDVGVEPLQIVIKMTECNNQPVCKISDSQGKEMCKDKVYIDYVKNIFGIK